MLHAGFMQVSCRLQSCQHVLMDACFMTVTCRRDAWSLHVTSMLPVRNMQDSCMQHAEFIQITSMEHVEFIQITCMQHAEFIQITCMQHAEFIQITCMQHAKFIQITCMQHDDFLHVLYMLKFYFIRKKQNYIVLAIGTKSIILYRCISIFIPLHFISRKEKETNVINSYKYP